MCMRRRIKRESCFRAASHRCWLWCCRKVGNAGEKAEGDEVPVAVHPAKNQKHSGLQYFRNCSLPLHTIYNHSTHNAVKMPSRGNPNVPNKQRKIASRAKVQKRSATNKISKNPRGTARSNVLHPTSGPLAPVSGKKARKLEKAKNHARRRAIKKVMEQEGEVEMTGKW